MFRCLCVLCGMLTEHMCVFYCVCWISNKYISLRFLLLLYIWTYYMVIHVTVCVCMWELGFCCCLKWAMGCSTAAAVCMLMLWQSWRTWEGRGKGQSLPTHIYTGTIPNCHFTLLQVENQRPDWKCWCFTASVQDDQSQNYINIKPIWSKKWCRAQQTTPLQPF